MKSAMLLLPLIVAMASMVASYHFKISLQRFANDCKGPIATRERISRDDHKCKDWEDGISFDSYDFTWNNHFNWAEAIEDYGECEIQVWEGTHCTGRYLGYLSHANSKQGPGNCYAGFADAQGVPGRTKSARVLCRK
ncbi:hypothetical protein EJ03DRAFT_75810 [Teratosphaeria nubilosa]|uniref:Uncharacterized protein n=1 Tax=Teratosphaeria nubilosa TaxID=161662 RepID=A0A6G1LMG8_9PEZI|nr:hypothetical protein EJ03DRAFT_75810 [Teratosphaeria nubilosa]